MSSDSRVREREGGRGREREGGRGRERERERGDSPLSPAADISVKLRNPVPIKSSLFSLSL